MPLPRTLSPYSEATLPTAFGPLCVRLYRDTDGTEPLVILDPARLAPENMPVRIHSACLTSESLGSLRCDCREQLNFALRFVAQHSGAVIYLHQEGRGIGLGEKLRAYALQEQGYDTVEANRLLGHPPDARDYETASLILRDLGIRSVRLMTNNPRKIAGLRKFGIEVVGRIPVVIKANPHSQQYLATKFTRMGHLGHETAELSHGEHTQLSPATCTANGRPARAD
jgi:3,4-dihydroxy 2-butanone 4-phosphate synthase / GTP cyclohydrolase II